jgi:hypothetical protein
MTSVFTIFEFPVILDGKFSSYFGMRLEKAVTFRPSLSLV